MPLDANGCWYPSLFPKQVEVFNDYRRAVLLDGPRLGGKTVALLEKVCRHLWETPGARVAMFSRVMKNSKDAGTWKILLNNIIPEWIAAGIGFEFTTKGYDDLPGPKVDGQTRTPFFKVRNMHGGESELMLFSLDDDNETEAKLKEREFSMIYFSELSNFKDQRVLSIALLSLRMKHLTFEQHQWISDTNPGEEGEDSWIYQTFYKQRTQEYEDYVSDQKAKELPVLGESEFKNWQKSLGLHIFLPEENPYLDPRQLEELKAHYAYDAGLYARYVLGKWVYGDGDKSRHFRSFFRPNIHVWGNCDSKDESKWETILPSPNCYELITGFDPGDTNHAAVIIEKQLHQVFNPVTKKYAIRGFFSVLDEVVILKTETSIEDFTALVMEKITDLEAIIGRQVSLERAYSDMSALEKYSASGDSFPAKQIFAASGQRLYLEGVAKGRNSVRMRVQLMKLLLSQNRFKVSAHCTNTIKMLRDLKKGRDESTYVVPNEDKHVFDAITYALFRECEEELLSDQTLSTVGRRDGIAVNVR